MNFGIVTKVLGNILIIECTGMIFPLLVSIHYRQDDWKAFLASIAITGFCGCIARFYSLKYYKMKALADKNGNHNKRNTQIEAIKVKEALTIVSMSWVLVSLFGSLPFIISGSIPHFVDALFETVSGFTTTGGTILSDVETLPMGILFWRSLTHWIGGMGILVFTVAILPALGISSFQLFKAESSGPSADRLVPRIRDTAKVLYVTYIIMTIVLAIFLIIGGMSLFDALVHTFGTVGTGGLSTKNISIGAYNSTYINVVISVFMVLSSINFSHYYALYKGKWKDIIKDQELKFFLGTVLISIILIAVNVNKDHFGNIFKSLEHSFFQVSSIISTTGYSTVDFDQWPTFSKFILFILMFIGGCAGSTAGGMKCIRVVVLLKLIKREFQKIFHPRAVIPIKIEDKTLSTDAIHSISSFVFLYFVIFVIGTLLLSLEGISLVSASSAAASTLCNIGPGFEMVGPMQNFGEFSALSKLLMSGLMLVGRLGLFTVIALFNARVWKDEI